MVDTSANNSAILALKKQLSSAILNNNYNLQSPEVLLLSQELDELMLPIFVNQIHFYKSIYTPTAN